jgi:hypothetical protein
VRALLVLAAILFATLFGAGLQAVWAEPGSTVSVKPSVVEVGLNFSGADVHIHGTAPEDTQVVLKVDGPTESVELSKKGKVLGLFWMTVDRAEVENMPAFHLVRSSDELGRILSADEQIRLGVDPASANITSQAQAVDPSDELVLSKNKEAEFVLGLRDMYIRDGRYAGCVNCPAAQPGAGAGQTDTTAPSTGGIHLVDGQWDTWVKLPSDAPLGDYSVASYWVKNGQVVSSDFQNFSVKKAGLADWLSSMAKENGATYGAMCLGIMIAAALGVGILFPRPRGGR